MTASHHPDGPENEYASGNSVIDPRDFRHALGSYATGVTVITASGPSGKPTGLTCNSFASVSLNPPLVLWSLLIYSPNIGIFQNASHFAVNVLGASQQDLARQFATPSEDKFAGVDWQRGLGDAPLLSETVAAFQCRSTDRYYGGDHVIFLGAVEAYTHNRNEPLLFARGAFGHFVSRP
jgi:flavin reductase (DIM6/NTAB) family NADH-FMN oxidoreductase RutF